MVRYDKIGEFGVKLTVSNDSEESVVERKQYVKVSATAPVAAIGLPEEGYLSPWVASYVPLNVPLHFTDLSTGSPSEWAWQLPGSDNPNPSEQNPVATYKEKGLYSLALRATNEAGTSEDALYAALQAGGEQEIWNIPVEENSGLRKVVMPYALLGNYAGSNWLGMVAFAEKFSSPAAPMWISKVSIYFASVTTISPEAKIKVAVCGKGDDGMPGDELASAQLGVEELKYSDDTFEKTEFILDKPVKVDGEFFIVVSGIPNKASGYEADDIAIFCSPERPKDGKTTTFHLLEVWDQNDRPTGEYEWYENVDEPLSMAVTPWVAYDGEYGSAVPIESDAVAQLKVRGNNLILPDGCKQLTVYNIGGAIVMSVANPPSEVSLSHLPQGIYIAAAGSAVVKVAVGRWQ